MEKVSKISEAKRQANKRYAERNRDKMNANSRRYMKRKYDENVDVSRSVSKRKYNENDIYRENKLQRQKEARLFLKTGFGELCNMF